ncbi:MAG: hypothetical protein KDI98_07530 [Hyphomicrobiaceae bacterium]|nr:hypothetical protein [Hyphomicrobiaceae bacterium]
MTTKLRSYLQGLSGDARALIVRSIEQSKARGEMSQVHDLILSAMRGVMRNTGDVFPRVRTAERAFFEPLTPIIIDEHMPDKERGRIERRSLRPIWTWLTRDLAQGRFDDTLADARATAAIDDEKALCSCGRKLRKTFLPAAREAIEETEARYGGLHRLAGQLGTPRVVEDLHDMLDIFEHEDVFAEFRRRLPAKVPPGRDGFQSINLAFGAFEGTPLEVQILAYGYLIPRLGAPGDLVRYAVEEAHTDRPSHLRKTRHAPAVSALLGEITREIEVVTNALERDRNSDTAVNALRRFHEHVRAMTSALDNETQDNWFRRLAQLRTRMSDRLAHEIEPIPGILRRALKAVAKDGVEIVPDSFAVTEANVGARLLMAARHAAESLAINSLVTDTHKQVEQLIETLGQRAMDDLEKIGPTNRDARLARAELAIDLGAIVLGREYGKLMQRKRDAALGAAQGSSRRAS